jgi:hypothetical protein
VNNEPKRDSEKGGSASFTRAAEVLASTVVVLASGVATALFD